MIATEDVLARLAERGYRDTRSRRLIAEAVASRTSVFSAQEVYAELAPQGVGRATVFRTLSLLHELRLLNRIHAGVGCDQYTICEPRHHHHLVCTSCGAVFPLSNCPISQDVERTAGGLGFQIEGHQMEVYGRCGACAGS